MTRWPLHDPLNLITAVDTPNIKQASSQKPSMAEAKAITLLTLVFFFSVYITSLYKPLLNKRETVAMETTATIRYSCNLAFKFDICTCRLLHSTK